MRIRIVSNMALPGGIVLEAEEPEEVLFLRMFVGWPVAVRQEYILSIANHGGTTDGKDYSILIQWEKQMEKLE